MLRRVRKYERARHPSGTETKAYVIWNYLMQHGGSKRRELCDAIGIPSNTPLTQFIRAGMINLDNGVYTANPDFDFDDLPASARREVMPQQNDVIDDVVVDQNVEPEEEDIEDDVEIMPDDDIPEPMLVRKPQTKRSAWDDYDDFILYDEDKLDLDFVEDEFCRKLKENAYEQIDDIKSYLEDFAYAIWGGIGANGLKNINKGMTDDSFMRFCVSLFSLEYIVNNPQNYSHKVDLDVIRTNFNDKINDDDLKLLLKNNKTSGIKKAIKDIKDYLNHKLRDIKKTQNGDNGFAYSNIIIGDLDLKDNNIIFEASCDLQKIWIHRNKSKGFTLRVNIFSNINIVRSLFINEINEVVISYRVEF